MRKLSNVEIADFCTDELEKQGYDVDYNEILNDIDVSVENDRTLTLDEEGNDTKLYTEEEIQKIKESFLNNFLTALEYED